MATKARPELTDEERTTLSYIARYVAKWGIAPTIYEVGEAFAVAPTTASRRIARLTRKGYLKRAPGARRAVRIVA